jgi:cysteine desulfurase/selenocysteine lyase
MLSESLRDDFPSLKRRRKGLSPIYFDNACMALKPNCVLSAMNHYYKNFPTCAGDRSRHWWSNEATKYCNAARQTIQQFIGAESSKEIIWTKNATEGINLIANSMIFNRDSTVLISDKEHNSNFIPFWKLSKQKGIDLKFIPTNEDNTFNFDAYAELLDSNQVDLVSLGHCSNLDGCSIDAKKIIKIAHEYNVKVMLDGAQSVPHQNINVQDLDVDFLAFSIHKMCGPTGMGVLYVKSENYDILKPFMVGGETVRDSFYDKEPSWEEPPELFEAGLQNYAGQIGAGAAAKYLMEIGRDKIESHEHHLNRHLTKKLQPFVDQGIISIIGPKDPDLRGGICTFTINIQGFTGEDGIDSQLSEKANIMVRTNAMCVHSWFNDHCTREYVDFATVRVSLYLYNTPSEIDVFVATLTDIFNSHEKYYGSHKPSPVRIVSHLVK